MLEQERGNKFKYMCVKQWKQAYKHWSRIFAEIQEKYLGKKRELWMASLDLKKAFDKKNEKQDTTQKKLVRKTN